MVGKAVFRDHSTPLKKEIKFGKRVSWIDQSHFIPLKIESWNREGKLWKILSIEWQK